MTLLDSILQQLNITIFHYNNKINAAKRNAPHLDMTDQWQASRKMMLFHLEAASSYAEELGEATTLHLIDRTRREIEQPFLEEQAYESKPPSVA